MLMTTQNSVSHMTYLLKPGCKRSKSGESNAPIRFAFPIFLKVPYVGKIVRFGDLYEPKRIEELKSANRRRKSSSRNSR